MRTDGPLPKIINRAPLRALLSLPLLQRMLLHVQELADRKASKQVENMADNKLEGDRTEERMKRNGKQSTNIYERFMHLVLNSRLQGILIHSNTNEFLPQSCSKFQLKCTEDMLAIHQFQLPSAVIRRTDEYCL